MIPSPLIQTGCVLAAAAALSLLGGPRPLTVAAARPVPHGLTPISAALGLADVAVSDPDQGFRAVVVELQLRDGSGGVVEVPLVRTDAGELWTGRLMAGRAPNGTPKISYTLRLTDDDRTWTVGPFTASASPGETLETPDWAKGAVWYQVFPERFRNGEPTNDPEGPEFFAADWAADWQALTPDELEAARARALASDTPRRLPASRRGGQRYNVLGDRRYGGDLQGLVEKLDELADLGVTAIYLNPIFDAHSAHKYDASDFRHIDPTLAAAGSRAAHDRQTAGETADSATWVWTESDRYFLDVVLPEARRRGIRVVLDGVWNHVGVRFWAFRDVVERGSASAYREWFDARFVPEDGPELAGLRARYPAMKLKPGALMGWQSWNGRNGTLPIFSRSIRGGEMRLHPEVESHIFAVTRRWMDPNGDGDPSDGIDGWRLDVVPDVPMPFWEAWRAHAKSINPDAVLIAEVWHDAAAYFGGRAFDAQMNYPFAMAATAWLGRRPEASAADLGKELGRVFSHAPQVDLVQMNLLTSHDTERLASMLANPGREYSQGAKVAAGADGYDTRRPPASVYSRLELAAALQATLPGAPMVFYGDEYGVHGADDPDCRKPLPWPDLGPNANFDDDADPAVRERYRRWLRLRGDARVGAVLRFGSVHLHATGSPDVFAFERRLNGVRVVVAINRGAAAADLSMLPGATPANATIAAESAVWWLAGTGHAAEGR